jgi:triphosphoribosyl-dephospho-CoA synthase
MAVNEDTNILARHDMETLVYVKEYAARVLDSGGMLTESGREEVYEMDRRFIKENISPGGSADLLAVTVMFYLLSHGENLYTS